MDTEAKLFLSFFFFHCKQFSGMSGPFIKLTYFLIKMPTLIPAGRC